MVAKNLILFLIGLLFPLNIVAIDNNNPAVNIDGIYYSLNKQEKTAWVTTGAKYMDMGNDYLLIEDFNYEGDLVIPETVIYDGVVYTVTGICGAHHADYFYRTPQTFKGPISSIILPNTIKELRCGVFYGLDLLKSVTLSDDISVFPDLSFTRCANLRGFTFSDKVKQVGDYAFFECIGITSLPGNMERAGKYAFGNCTGLTNLILLNIKKISGGAFYGCSNVERIEISKDVEIIGSCAFSYIEKLTDVTYYATTPIDISDDAFDNSHIENVTLHVPASSIETYKSEVPWNRFKKIVAIEGTKHTFKLTYMVDGEQFKVVEINEGDSITPEAVPTKEGYTFSGWGDIPDVMPSQDVTVSGTFTINKYKLTYIIDEIEYKTIEVEYGSVITPEEAPDAEGYTFSGWDNVPETMPAGNVTVTGHFTVNKYTITYYVDGEVYKTVEMAYGTEITAEEEPTKEGYDFSGWSWIPSKMPAEDVTVTGSFTKASYEVDGATYELDEYGAILTSMDDAADDVVINTEVTIRGKKYMIFVIGEGAFQGNERIKSLTIPDGIEVIMPNAFDGCRNLIKMMLGKTVRQIGSKAFAGIGKAAAYTRADAEPLTIECYAKSVPQADYDCFDGVDVASAILRVNDNLTKDYKTTSPWNQFGTILGFNEKTSVISIFADEEDAAVFSIDGRRIEKPQKGMNIIRTSQGTRKVVVK